MIDQVSMQPQPETSLYLLCIYSSWTVCIANCTVGVSLALCGGPASRPALNYTFLGAVLSLLT